MSRIQISKKLTEKLFCKERIGEYKTANTLSRSIGFDFNKYKMFLPTPLK